MPYPSPAITMRARLGLQPALARATTSGLSPEVKVWFAFDHASLKGWILQLWSCSDFQTQVTGAWEHVDERGIGSLPTATLRAATNFGSQSSNGCDGLMMAAQAGIRCL